MFVSIKSDLRLYRDFCTLHQRLSLSQNNESIKKKIVVSITEMLRRNELSIEKYAEKFHSDNEYSIFKTSPISDQYFGQLITDNPEWTVDVSDYFAFTRTCHEFVRLNPQHAINSSNFFDEIDLAVSFFKSTLPVANDINPKAKKLYELSAKLEQNEDIPKGFVLSEDSQLDSDILLNTGQIIAKRFDAMFSIYAVIHKIEQQNLSNDCLEFLLGYLTSISDVFIQKIGGRSGSIDSMNLLLITLRNCFENNNYQNLFDFVYGQMKNSNRNPDFIRGLEAGGLDANAFLKGENHHRAKGLMNGLSKYS